MGDYRFQPSPNKAAAVEALRKGIRPEECAVKFDISTRTASRYLKQIKEGQFIKPPRVKEARDEPVRITIEMGSKDFAKLLALLGKTP